MTVRGQATFWRAGIIRLPIQRFNDQFALISRRTYEDFRLFDKQLHRCIYDRKFSQLPELRKNELREDNMAVSIQ